MKRTLASILFIFMAIAMTAQQKASFISLQAGASIPVGKFHATELPDGGFARTGFSGSLEGAWFFKSWLGAGAAAGLQLHPVDVVKLAEEKLSGNAFMTGLSIRSEPWMSVSLYAGLYFQFPLVQKLKVTAKALGGMIYAQTPYQLYKAEYFMIGKNWYEVTSAGDYEGSFLAGAGLRYDLNDCIGIVLNSDFTYNVMDFNFLLSDGSIRTDEKVVAFVNLAAGIVIKF